MTRGELWWADFGIPFGSEPGFRRPVVILQDDSFNRSRIHTTIIVPLTTNLKLEDAPGNVVLGKEQTKLSKDSVAVVSQITVIDKSRLIERIDNLDLEVIKEIEYGIKMVLSLMY